MDVEHVRDIGEAIDQVGRATAALRLPIDETGWLDEVELDEVESLERELASLYNGHLDRCREEWGDPLYTDKSDRYEVDLWYPEALHVACWSCKGGYTFLAQVHHDKETPIYIEVGYLTDAEMAGLRA